MPKADNPPAHVPVCTPAELLVALADAMRAGGVLSWEWEGLLVRDDSVSRATIAYRVSDG
jgi:hypothetical protein